MRTVPTGRENENRIVCTMILRNSESPNLVFVIAWFVVQTSSIYN